MGWPCPSPGVPWNLHPKESSSPVPPSPAAACGFGCLTPESEACPLQDEPPPTPCPSALTPPKPLATPPATQPCSPARPQPQKDPSPSWGAISPSLLRTLQSNDVVRPFCCWHRSLLFPWGQRWHGGGTRAAWMPSAPQARGLPGPGRPVCCRSVTQWFSPKSW